MVYLYAGLGLLMLSGIMAIFEMGLSLTGQSMIPTPTDPYLQSTDMKMADKIFLKLLQDRNAVSQGLSSQALCTALIQSYSVQNPEQSPWKSDNRMPIDQGEWIRSCQLNRGSHRIVIMPPDPGHSHMPYKLFSCALDGGNNQCSFEQE